MAELRESGKSLYIRNNTNLPWTLHEKAGNGQKVDIELKGAGREDSIAYLPPIALDLPGVARNFALGKVTISPDLEDEMLDLIAPKVSTIGNVLDEIKAKLTVEEAPQSRAIDGKTMMQSFIDGPHKQVRQSRITNDIDEFTNPSPVKIGDKTVNVMTGEVLDVEEEPTTIADIIKSISVTRPTRLPEEN
jgi:hypothetical protein